MRLGDRQQQFVHLARLAWELRELGLATLVELPRDTEPAVIVPTASDRWKVRAVRQHDGTWVFSWGRRPEQRVAAPAAQAAERIAAVVR